VLTFWCSTGLDQESVGNEHGSWKCVLGALGVIIDVGKEVLRVLDGW
jgi:hypothetical protein